MIMKRSNKQGYQVPVVELLPQPPHRPIAITGHVIESFFDLEQERIAVPGQGDEPKCIN